MTEALSDSHSPTHDDQILSGNVHPTVHPRYEAEVLPVFDNTYLYSNTATSGSVEPEHVPDGTFENTWQPPLELGSEHIQSGVWSESDIMTGSSEYVPLEQSDYAPKRSEDKELSQADLSAIDEMIATATKVQEAVAKTNITESAGQEISLPEEAIPKEVDSQKEQPRWTIPRLASRPAPKEVFATAPPDAPVGTHIAAAILNDFLKDGFGLGPEAKSAPTDPLDIYEPKYAEQLKSAREIIRAEVARIDATLKDGTESNRQSREADRRKQLRNIVDQAEMQAAKDEGYDDDIDLYQVSLIQRNVQKLRDAAEGKGQPFGKSQIIKLYGHNYERASQMNQPNAPELDDAMRQKYLAQERRAKIALLFRRTDGSFSF